MNKRWALRSTVLVMCCLSAGQSLADSESEAIAARIEKLEALVSYLEIRVSALESPSVQNPPPAQNVENQSAWAIKANWRSLRKGMSKKQVKSILGEPQNTNASGAFENWIWRGPYAEVTFYSEKLYGWQEPN